MIETDREEFFEAWSKMIRIQAGQELEDPDLRMLFKLLKDLDLIEIQHALAAHCQKSVFVARAAEIRDIVFGNAPKPDVLYAHAQNDDTPIGVFVRLCVGEFGLKSIPRKHAVERIQAHADQVSDFIFRWQNGQATDDEIRIIGSRGIDVTGNLCPGLPGPRLRYRQAMHERQAALCKPQLEEQPEEEKIDTEASRAAQAKMKQELTKLGWMRHG